MTGAALAASLAAGLAAAWLAGQTAALLTRAGLVAPNFQGLVLPRPLGLVVVPSYLAGVAVASLITGQPWTGTFPYLVALTGLGFFGLADDVLGRGQHGGFRGHGSALLRTGRLTGGGLKALGAGLVALSLVGAGRSPPGLLVDAGLVALGANAVNLLDVRPGRALVLFWGAVLAIAVTGVNTEEILLLLPLVAASVGLAPWDLGGRAMLGDTGANALGAAAGLFAARTLAPAGREIVLALLVVLHLGAEFGSLSRLLESVFVGGQARGKGKERNSRPPEE